MVCCAQDDVSMGIPFQFSNSKPFLLRTKNKQYGLSKNKPISMTHSIYVRYQQRRIEFQCPHIGYRKLGTIVTDPKAEQTDILCPCCGDAEDSNFVGCYAVSIGRQLPTFQKIILSPFSGSNSILSGGITFQKT